MNVKHRPNSPLPNDNEDFNQSTKYTVRKHPHLQGIFSFSCSCTFILIYNSYTPGIPCNEHGESLPAGTPPLHPDSNTDEPYSWEPFASRADFDFAHFHFVEAQSSEGEINHALDILRAYLLPSGGHPPWANTQEMYETIDSIQNGDAPWEVIKIKYTGPKPERDVPAWMEETYELCTRNVRQVLHNQLATADFKDNFDPSPYQQFNGQGDRVYSNLMSGDWAWRQAVSSLILNSE